MVALLDVDSFVVVLEPVGIVEPEGMVKALPLAIGTIPPPRMGPRELARLGSNAEAKLRSVAIPWNNVSPVEGTPGVPGAND